MEMKKVLIILHFTSFKFLTGEPFFNRSGSQGCIHIHCLSSPYFRGPNWVFNFSIKILKSSPIEDFEKLLILAIFLNLDQNPQPSLLSLFLITILVYTQRILNYCCSTNHINVIVEWIFEIFQLRNKHYSWFFQGLQYFLKMGQIYLVTCLQTTY